VLVVLLVGLGVLRVAAECPRWNLYKQCDPTWGRNRLGTSNSETICTAGCAMSSVSMILASENIKVDGKRADPGTLNDWLTRNGGYVDGDLLVWDAVSKLGPISMYAYTSHLSRPQLNTYIHNCMPVVVNVRGGTHWVLVTNYTSNPDVWEVNDPYFNQNTYNYSTMLRFVVYKHGAHDPAHQESVSRLEDAVKYGDDDLVMAS
jgi:hypothetical protein